MSDFLKTLLGVEAKDIPEGATTSFEFANVPRGSVGLIMALDWKYGDLAPQREFERYRAHPFVAELLEGAVTIATGARTIPEGGYHALGRLMVPGALVVGDGAGFVNMEKIKGIHGAILSGMAAADTVAAGIADASDGRVPLTGYAQRLEGRGLLAEMPGLFRGPLPDAALVEPATASGVDAASLAARFAAAL